MKKWINYVATIGILAFIIFLRVYRLDELPLSMHIDEAGLGLNAWSIANYGTDRYGHVLPICPINFYGEQSAFYTYFCAILIKIWGLNIYTLRMPGVIMGVVAVWFGALICKEKWGNKGFFTGLILMGIFPYYIMNSRFALDCNVMLGMITIALYSLVKLMKRLEVNPQKKYYAHFMLTGVLLGLVLYTYIIAAIVIAVFGVLFGLYYIFNQKENRGRRFLQLVFMALPLVVMVIPLCLVVCVNYFDWNAIETSLFSVPKLIVNRTEEVSFTLASLPGKLKSILRTLTTDGKYGSSNTYWTMYWWSVPFVIWGGLLSIYDVIKKWKKREQKIESIMLCLVIGESIMFILCGIYNYHINGIFIALSFFCVKGILSLYELLKNTKAQRIYIGIVAGLYLMTFAGFSMEYYATKEERAYQVYGGVAEALSLVPEEARGGEIYILDDVGEFYFLTNPISPEEFVKGCDELGYIKDYGNLHFYEPQGFEEKHVYVCTKASGRYNTLSDSEVTGHTYCVQETEHYYVFYK